MGSTFQHTPEPWHVAEKKAVRLDVAYFIRPVDDRNCDYGATLAATSEKDAHRIVACVNACAGLHTKVVQTIAAFGGMSQDTAVAAVLQEAAKATSELEALKADNKALANAVLNALYGTLLDEHGNRDENGLLAWGKAEDARNALIEVATLARKVGA